MKKVLFIMSALTMGLVGCGGTEDIANNPLVAEWNTPYQTPPFSKIEMKHYEPAVDYAIEQNRAEIDAIINNPEAPTFENTIVAMAESGELLGRVTGVFYVLNNCVTSPEMQQIALNISPKLTALSNDVSLNPELFARVKAVYDQRESLDLDQEDKMLLEDTYKGFARSGALLEGEAQELYRQYTTELSQLTLEFGQNALKATNAFSLNITDEAKVAELPDFVKEGLAADAASRGQEGWTVTLDAPSYGPFMTYSSQRDLKEQLYKAYNTRAKGGEFDNMENIRKIANLRLQIANLLGYETYADYVLEDRMAESRSTVNNFLDELCDATMGYAKKDVATVTEFAHSLGFEGDLMPWDWGYYNEKFKEAKYSINDEQIKPYLKLENAVDAVFMLAGKLYGLTFTPAPEIETYHPEASAYEVKDENGELMAILYLDFFPRESKRQGAWMTEFRGVKVKNGVEQRPLVQLVMNFTKPTANTPSLLTFDEFTTFLHEFGHGLHGILAKGKYEIINGTAVKRDFVELPSQIMENWATEKEYLDLWAKHYETGEAMPAELIEKLIAAKNYLAAYFNIRQLSFGMLDMAWHTITTPYEGDVLAFELEALKPTQVMPVVEGCAMGPGFTHIFSGGYASGYYGYKWAEVLAADAFSYFKEKGIFSEEVADKFRYEVLEKGGHEHPMDLYVKFRGHKPQTQALIDQMGLE
ncbi:MAG: M3 family metallopeptidase [Alistipes sp.]|jgi:peptidyl-dipeptidase Dcp|nr:M3 family metallopeptidase [Alistipes sp.]